MLNQNFLEVYNPEVLEKFPLFSIYKDREFKTIALSPFSFKCTGFNKYEHSLGLTDYELPWHEAADLYRVQEVNALVGEHYSVIENVKMYDGEIATMLTKKHQLKDQAGNVLGLSVLCVPICSNKGIIAPLNEICARSSRKVLSIGRKNSSIVLSKREEECLFYLLQGRSMKLIANILAISPRTVETHIENLKVKFDCNNKYEVIDKALTLGFGNNIPTSLVQRELGFLEMVNG